ncbi:MAG: 50S ribosomal protein L6, partial [Anaerolineae bacterium]|nr:50S ribosomal protein L6 [Anaerolineae bacterium]MDW8071401.1 50S ribosomal protein L6 [Anaerolineae bacterium]
MSRIGRMPIAIPAGVSVDVQGNQVLVKGAKGQLVRRFDPDMQISVEGSQLIVRRPTDQRRHRALHGLTRALLNNMVLGVSQGFSRTLEIEGVGYRAEMQGNKLVLYVGYSHPVVFEPPAGIAFSVDKGGRTIMVSGADKELVGEIAARIRRVRPPEPYKGKG